MTSLSNRLPLGRVMVAVDIVLIVWTVAWIVVGTRVSHEVNGLSNVTDTVVRTGTAIDSVAGALQSLESVPFVGGRLSGPIGNIRSAGQSAIASGRSSRQSVHNLSPLLGFAIALIPTVPLLAIYVPLRVSGIRERRAVARLLRDYRDDPRLPRLLAQRALSRLPYHDLAAAALRGDRAAEGSTDRLAAAELERVGIERPPPW